MDQEQIFQIQMMEQEVNQYNEHLKLIEQNHEEMQDLILSLEEIEKEESKEILANIGKRIYIPVKISEKKLIVEVGNKKFVKKTIPETKKIIKEQLEKLIAAKTEISDKIEELHERMKGIIEIIEKEQEKEKKKK